MSHPPVSADAAPAGDAENEMPEAELPCDDGNDRLREAHLKNGQAETTALFAPYFALAGLSAALLVAWSMAEHGRIAHIVLWLAAVSAI